MAILIVEHNGTLEGTSLVGRILIGRRPSNHVVVNDPAVSRIHAWIDTAGRQYCLTDAGSRTGTFVNRVRVNGMVQLKDGDRINIGPASLIFRAEGSLPAGVSQLDFGGRTAEHGDGGILFDCTCGAPLWISSAFAGRLGKCRFCGAVVRVPQRPGVKLVDDFVTPATPAAEKTVAPAASCGVCQSPIGPAETLTTCPACGLTFHADCWAENYGCSAYGCSQVNVLLPKTEPAEVDEAPVMFEAATPPPTGSEATIDLPRAENVPREYALLAASVVATLLGAFTFGVPALAVLSVILTHLNRRRGQPPHRVVIVAAGLALVGIVAGMAISYIWWISDRAPDVIDVGSDGS